MIIPAGSFGFDSTIVVARNEASTLRCGPAVTDALLKFDMLCLGSRWSSPHSFGVLCGDGKQ